ncbi:MULTISPECIES: hypothetical protein [Pirellulaceae]|nr:MULTISPECIES: hypothetical protein [Pirellulaceae]
MITSIIMSHLCRQRSHLALVVGSLALLSLSLGCGSQPTGDIVPTSPAAGTATYKGKPLEFYQIRFVPEDGRPAAGVTDEEGHFTMGTNDTGDGAPSGKHRVAINYVGPPMPPDWGVTDFSPIPPPKFKVPAKFSDPEKSGITVEVPEDGKTDFVIEIE